MQRKQICACHQHRGDDFDDRDEMIVLRCGVHVGKDRAKDGKG